MKRVDSHMLHAGCLRLTMSGHVIERGRLVLIDNTIGNVRVPGGHVSTMRLCWDGNGCGHSVLTTPTTTDPSIACLLVSYTFVGNPILAKNAKVKIDRKRTE